MDPVARTYEQVAAFVAGLAAAGVRHACVSPGSRSSPLALLLGRHPAIRIWLHLDERSSGFFALGLAKIAREPVAILCTSGTAAANLLPAVVEARYGGVPLIVLTADRPPELRDAGAPQTIDQLRLYGPHAKWFVDVPVLGEAEPGSLQRGPGGSAEAAFGNPGGVPRGPTGTCRSARCGCLNHPSKIDSGAIIKSSPVHR